MEQHPVVGFEILRGVDFLGEAKNVVRSHHERWDGKGYPDGLVGEATPIAARVFAVADTLDALTTDRPYRPGRTFAEARTIIAGGSGTQFDPAIAGALDLVPDETLQRSRSSTDEPCPARDRPHRRRRPVHPEAHRHHARGRHRPGARRGRRRHGGGRAADDPDPGRSSSST